MVPEKTHLCGFCACLTTMAGVVDGGVCLFEGESRQSAHFTCCGSLNKLTFGFLGTFGSWALPPIAVITRGRGVPVPVNAHLWIDKNALSDEFLALLRPTPHPCRLNRRYGAVVGAAGPAWC